MLRVATPKVNTSCSLSLDDTCICQRRSREETDHLFDLCERFDLHFITIDDRFEYPGRTVEELKQRYYQYDSNLMILVTQDIRRQS